MMMHCVSSDKSEMMRWQQQDLDENEELGFLGDESLSELVNGAMKPGRFWGSDFDISISNKRKADKTHKLKVSEEKKMKGCGEEDSKITREQNSSSSSAKAPKTDYIHVRARRGQATDSHSLAERVRREKISERMKYLQDLVPGCNKITGKAGMLDEIINYVQSLQRQVEFLSMKLAAINPRLDLDLENYLLKEIMGADHFNTTSGLGQGPVSTSNLGMDMALRRTTSAPVPIPHNFLHSSNQIQHMTWEDELQNLYNMEYEQARSTSLISHPFTGFQEQDHVKLEM